MTTIEIYPRKLQWLSSLVACIGFACVGAGIIFLGYSVPLIVLACAWVMLGIGFIGLVAVTRALRIQTLGPALILSSQGINYVPAPFGIVPWDEVVHVGVRSNGLVIAVRNNLPYLNALPILKRCVWWSGLSLPGDLLLIRHESVEMELGVLFSLIHRELQSREQSA